jgi:hypothetical protein
MITVFYARDGRGFDRSLGPNEMGCGPYPTEDEAVAAMLAKRPDGQPDVTAADAAEAVRRWRVEAGEAGDLAMVETCDRTEAGEPEALAAWCRCEREADSSHAL